ncbi:MAG: inositol monophosphatase [Thermoleophilia bacterium]
MTTADRWLPLLRRACDAAGDAVRDMPPGERRRPVGAGAGGDTTMVVDRAAEDAVVAVLESGGMPFRLISEEVGEREAGEGGPWIVLDPIDGSLNAKRGLPVFATSIALAEGPAMGDVTLGVVRDHGTGEEWIARRGGGATVDGAPVRAEGEPGVLELLLVEGAYPAHVAPAAAALGARVGRLRALGSLALSLCHAAAGRGDAIIGLGTGRSIDIAAAQLVAREAGLLVGLPGEDDLPGTTLRLDARFHVLGARDPGTLALLAGLLPPPA